MTQETRSATPEPHPAPGGRPLAGNAPPSADLIVLNAKVLIGHLAQPTANALAVKKGRIYAVGTDAEILSLKDSSSRLIDAGGRRLIPGISDAHIHLLNESNYTYSLRWDGVPTLSRALALLSEQAGRTPEGHWVKVIGGWSPYQFEENCRPTMDELRKAVPDRRRWPVDSSARIAVRLLKNGTPKTYPGFSHGMLTVNAEVLNRDLLAFMRGAA